VQLKLEERVAKVKAKKAESLNDEEEHKEVFTLKNIDTRLQTRVNRYYDVEEVEEELDVDSSTNVDINDEPIEFNPFNDKEYNESADRDLDIIDENM
jgi:hypothetical protein